MAGKRMDGALDNVLRRCVPTRAESRMQMFEHIVEDRPGATDAGNMLHWPAIKISDPYTHCKFRRVTESPVVPEIRTRARLARDGKIKSQRCLRAKLESARVIVAQDIGDQICRPRISHSHSCEPALTLSVNHLHFVH